MAGPIENLSRVELIVAALQTHESKLRRFVSARVSACDVDDVLQVAALRAMERAPSLQDPTRVLAWLYRLHRNIIVDAARKRAIQQRLIDDLAPVPDIPAPEPIDTCKCSLHLAKYIGERYAPVLLMVDSGEFSISEAAQKLGLSTNVATVRLHRARKKLRQRMRAHCGVTSVRDCHDCRCVHESCCPN